MSTVNLAQARARFREWVARAERGEEVVIARRGRPVARLTAVSRPVQPRQPLDLAALRTVLAAQPMARGASAARLVRRMRDQRC